MFHAQASCANKTPCKAEEAWPAPYMTHWPRKPRKHSTVLSLMVALPRFLKFIFCCFVPLGRNKPAGPPSENVGPKTVQTELKRLVNTVESPERREVRTKFAILTAFNLLPRASGKRWTHSFFFTQDTSQCFTCRATRKSSNCELNTQLWPWFTISQSLSVIGPR